MTPAEELLAAAERLEALHAQATEGPWTVTEDYEDLVIAAQDALDPDGDGLAGTYRSTHRIAGHDLLYDEGGAEDQEVRASFALMAVMRSVAGPLAAFLRSMGEYLRENAEDDTLAQDDALLAIARAVNAGSPA